MMPKFLYIFGYETPKQRAANQLHGWDDEDSEAFFIEATTADEAHEWGCRVSQHFIRHLYG